MSWSIRASGTPAEVRGQVSEQLKYPLAEPPAGLEDAGERQTVQQVFDLCEQILSTFDVNNQVTIIANGRMGFKIWDGVTNTRSGCYQEFNLSIKP